MAITDDALETSRPLDICPPELYQQSMMEGEQIFFTYVDRARNVITGYKLRKDLVALKVWSMNLDKQGEKIMRVETQFQTASAVDHLHFTPTAFSGENIIYKHIDSNIFALATVSTHNGGE